MKAVQKDPQMGKAHLKLAETYLRLSDGRNAVREYVNAADLLKEDKNVQLKAGNFLYIAKRFEDARARAQNVLKMDPNNLDARLLSGRATFALNGKDDQDDGVRQVQEAIRLNPKASGAYSLLGAMQNLRGETAAAEKSLRQAVELDPKSTDAHLALGNFLVGLGRQTEAEASYKAAYALDPKNAEAARALAAFYMSSGRGREAEPYLKSLADNSQNPKPTLDLADYYMAMNRRDDAIALLTKAAARKDGGTDASVKLAAARIRPEEEGRGPQDHRRSAGPQPEEPAGAAHEGRVPASGEEARRGLRARQGRRGRRSPFRALAEDARHPVYREEAAG